MAADTIKAWIIVSSGNQQLWFLLFNIKRIYGEGFQLPVPNQLLAITIIANMFYVLIDAAS